MLNLGARVIVGLQRRPQLENIEILKYWDHYEEVLVLVLLENAYLWLEGSCIKYLNTLNKVQIDQKSTVGLPIVPAYCLTITLNFLLC